MGASASYLDLVGQFLFVRELLPFWRFLLTHETPILSHRLCFVNTYLAKQLHIASARGVLSALTVTHFVEVIHPRIAGFLGSLLRETKGVVILLLLFRFRFLWGPVGVVLFSVA